MATTTIPSGPNDAYATTQTINFIEQLKTALADAKNVLNQKQMKYNNASTNKNALSDQYTSASSSTTLAKSSLEEAEKAQQQIDIITDFFKERTDVTSQMAETAKTTATKMYEATEFIGEQGLERIDDILNIVIAYNKKETSPQYQWTHPFMSAAQTASAKGHHALKAAVKATKDSFTTLVSTLQIDFRTRSYYHQCQSYQKMMAQLVERLTAEYVLLKLKTDNIEQKLNQAEVSLTIMNSELQAASFDVAQLQAEFTAAQKGASYTGSASPVTQ